MALMTMMRERMHVVLWTLLALFLLSMSIGGLVGGANILDQLFGRVDPTRVVARINGVDISPNKFNQLVSQQLSQTRASGQQVNDFQIQRARDTAWDNLLQDILVSEEVEKLKLTASDEEILFHLTNNPPPFLQNNESFQTDGQFDLDKYRTALSNPQGDEWSYIEDFMRSTFIPNYKLQQYLNQSVVVTDREIWAEFIKKNINYTIDAIHITGESIPKEKSEPTLNELHEEYNTTLTSFEHGELRNISYVLWKKDPSAIDTAQTVKLSEDIAERARSGEDFGSLATLYSQDPGSQTNGGDLGWFGKGRMVKPFEEAAFNADKETIVGPIESRFGQHIIYVRDKKSENGEEQILASHILLKVEITPTSLSELKRSAILFSYDAQDSGFTAAAVSHGVETKSQPKLKDTDFRIQGLGSLRSAVQFAFNNTIGTVSDLFENNQYFAVFHIDSIIAPGIAAFDEVKDQLSSKVKQSKEKKFSRDKADALLVEVTSEEKALQTVMDGNKSLDGVRNESKNLLEGFTSIGRSNFVVGALLNANEGDLLGPLGTNLGWALIKVKTIETIDSTEYEIQKDQLRKNLFNREQNQVFQSWLDNLKSEAEIIDNRKYYF
ncbi:uncharacterized protein METZ01_LOCUS122257 [marine metagenome]|uniref:Periplasmic chaperone PpiD n=1 Tax=marine metagenome TaxID=408172 RepID=A0A381XYV2_9ZZZZ